MSEGDKRGFFLLVTSFQLYALTRSPLVTRGRLHLPGGFAAPSMRRSQSAVEVQGEPPPRSSVCSWTRGAERKISSLGATEVEDKGKSDQVGGLLGVCVSTWMCVCVSEHGSEEGDWPGVRGSSGPVGVWRSGFRASEAEQLFDLGRAAPEEKSRLMF